MKYESDWKYLHSTKLSLNYIFCNNINSTSCLLFWFQGWYFPPQISIEKYRYLQSDLQCIQIT